MVTPRRIQLSRARGWRMPPSTIKVDRTTRWGNPYRVLRIDGVWCCTTKRSVTDSGVSILCGSEAEAWDQVMLSYRGYAKRTLGRAVDQLRGFNLACWCAPTAPCHADVLLELANAPAQRQPEDVA